MFNILMGILCICSIGFFALSKSEKDYQNCVELHGEEFAQNRRRILQILGPILFVGTLIALVVEYLF